MMMHKKSVILIFFFVSIFFCSLLPIFPQDINLDNSIKNSNNENDKKENVEIEDINKGDDVDAITENKNEPKDNNINENILKIIQSIEGKNISNIPFKEIDDNIFLFMRGFGDAKLTWTYGVEFFKDYTTSIIQSPVFVQQANLSLLLLMKKNWYFGINYKEKVYDSSIYLGFIDIENNIKKHIRIGNKGINFPNVYPFIRGGKFSHLSPGLFSQFEGDNWRVDTIIRYDSKEKNKRLFYGKYEVVENKLSISNWKKAQYFYIPDNNLVGKKAIVYVKDGKLNDWHLLQKNEYSIDFRKNILILKECFINGVAINLFEESQVEDVIDDGKTYFLDTSLYDKINNDVYIEINGNKFLCLKKNETFSIFEIASIYDFNNIDEIKEVDVIDRNTNNKSSDFGVKLNDFNFNSSKLHSQVEVYLINKTFDYKNSFCRYPFFKNNSHIYLMHPDDDKNTFELLSSLYILHSDYVLPKNTNAEDIEVLKNGIPIFDFVYDEATHIINIKSGVSPSDKIEIRWSENKNYSSKGSLKLGIGAKYKPIEWLSLFIAGTSDLSVAKESNKINDKYVFSTGAELEYKYFSAGSYFGLDILTDRKDKTLISKNHFYIRYDDKRSFSIFSNPMFFLDFDVNKSDQVYLHSNIISSLDIWKINISGNISFQDKKNKHGIIESAGHNIKIPLYFLYMEESFFINNNANLISRANTIKWNKYINLEHSTFITYDGKFVQQGILSSLNPVIPQTKIGNFFLQLKIELNQKYKIYSNTLENYYISWKDSLISSYSSGVYNPLFRTEHMTFVFNWFYPREMNYSSGFNIQGINFDAHLYSDNNISLRKKDNISTSFRLFMAYNEIFITPYWERFASKQFISKLSFNYKDDFTSMFNSLKEEYWFFSVPIFYDLFDRTILSKMQISFNNVYTFSNTYGLEVSRLLLNTIQDLYTPLEFNTSFSRIIKSNNFNINASEYYSIKFEIKYLSQDLFQTKYETGILKNIIADELIRDYNLDFDFSKEFFNFYFKSNHKLFFYNNNNNKIGFENKFSIEVDKVEKQLIPKKWKEEISFLFSYIGKKSLIKMLFSMLSKFNLLDEREEKISISLFKESYSKKLGYKFSFMHTQRTKIGENGSIKLFADVSLLSTNRNSILLNFNIGLAGKIEY